MNKKYENKTVSIIIPIYNSEKYIGETIESVLNQSYEDIEIIVVDDCSTDNSKEIAKSYTEKYKNVVYFSQEKNEGVAVARNKGMLIAKGRYIAFLDSDDVWKPDKLSKQLELMDKKNAKICFTAIQMIDESGEIIKDICDVRDVVDYKFILKNTMIATSSVIIDRKLVGEFSMTLRRSGQDYSTWLKLMRDGSKAYGINEPLVKYRVRKNSLSSNKIKSIVQVFDIQTKDEGINLFSAIINVVFFILHGFKKRLL